MKHWTGPFGHCSNSRSQKKSYNWDGFKAMWKTLDIPNPKIIETLQTQSPCLFPAQS